MRPIGKLKALTVAREKRPGMYGDGGGLYLQVTGTGARSWIFKYWVPERDAGTGELVRDPATGKVRGTTREMGLGSYHVVTLEEARNRALECRQLRERGLDPIEARHDAKAQAALDQAKALKFADAATAYIAAHRAGWKNDRHVAQWETTLSTYAFPVFGDLSVQAIDTTLVMKCLEPIWSTKTETASRLRGRLESILDWARARGYRAGENPARWKGHLKHLLTEKGKVAKVAHHPAMPYGEVAAFLADLRGQEGIAARALEFLILTATRASETLKATWGELDLENAIWTIPPSRMKAGREHRIPLAPRAREILVALPRDGDFAFPNSKQKPLSDRTVLTFLKRMRKDVTTHGFRSSFRDWAAERTNFANEVVEMALAHTVGDKVQAAYRRGDLFDKRRKLMDAWGACCASKTPTPVSETVLTLRSA
jgi:integrase